MGETNPFRKASLLLSSVALSKTAVSVSPSPLEAIVNPWALSARFPGDSPVSLMDLKARKPAIVFRTFTTVRELLWYYCSAVCGSLTRQVWALILWWLQHHLVATSSLSLDMGYLFLVGSVISCCWLFSWLQFGALTGGDNHMSCYSAILNWKQTSVVFKCTV